MDLEEFTDSLAHTAPPDGHGRALHALWHEAKGDWRAAHRHAQAQKDEAGAWVHAYLHRVEGDEANAGHWYRRAGKPHATAPHGEEWREIAASLLSASAGAAGSQ